MNKRQWKTIAKQMAKRAERMERYWKQERRERIAHCAEAMRLQEIWDAVPEEAKKQAFNATRYRFDAGASGRPGGPPEAGP